MTTALSFLVVTSFMMGGWISLIKAMYEYAATAIEGSRCAASLTVT